MSKNIPAIEAYNDKVSLILLEMDRINSIMKTKVGKLQYDIEDINWGHVGDLNRILEQLKEIE